MWFIPCWHLYWLISFLILLFHQLFDFRGRLHKALESYYKLRGLQTRAGLARFELLTEENGKRLTVIKDNLKTSIDNISRFLEANNKSHHSIRLKAEEMIKTPQAASVAWMGIEH